MDYLYYYYPLSEKKSLILWHTLLGDVSSTLHVIFTEINASHIFIASSKNSFRKLLISEHFLNFLYFCTEGHIVQNNKPQKLELIKIGSPKN